MENSCYNAANFLTMPSFHGKQLLLNNKLIFLFQHILQKISTKYSLSLLQHTGLLRNKKVSDGQLISFG